MNFIELLKNTVFLAILNNCVTYNLLILDQILKDIPVVQFKYYSQILRENRTKDVKKYEVMTWLND